MARVSGFIHSTVFAIAALSTPAAALAQSSGAEQIDQVRRESRVHIGAVYMTPTIHLKELGVDSNVFNAAGEQQSDFTFTLAPRTDLWVPIARRALLRGTAETDLVWYAQYETERSIDPQFTGRGELYLHRITLFAESSYLNSRQRLNYEVDLRARHLSNATVAGVGVRLTPKLSLEAAARRSETKFDADSYFDGASLQRMLNQQTTGGSLTVRHRVTPLSAIVLRLEQVEDEFAFAPARDSRSIRVMPGIEFQPRALIKGSAFVGYRNFTPSVPAALPQFSGLVAQLGLSYSRLGSTTLSTTYRRDLTYSYEELQPFFIDNSIGASVRRALGSRFDVLLSTDRHSYEYKDLQPQLMALTLTPRTDVTWSYGANIGCRIGQGRIGFGASYWRRDSSTDYRDYNNLRFGTTVTYGF